MRKTHLPCTILLADSSTVLTSKIRAKVTLNISAGVYHHKLCEDRGKRPHNPPPPQFKDQSIAQGGRYLYDS